MTAQTLSQLSVAAAPVAETVATAVDSPAIGHTFAFLIAFAALFVIGTLLFFWRWRSRPGRQTTP